MDPYSKDGLLSTLYKSQEFVRGTSEQPVFKVASPNSPTKLISALGLIICPLSGRKTNGIFCDNEPVMNGVTGHSATRKQNTKCIITLLFIHFIPYINVSKNLNMMGNDWKYGIIIRLDWKLKLLLNQGEGDREEVETWLNILQLQARMLVCEPLRGGAVVTLDSQSGGPGFDSRLGHPDLDPLWLPPNHSRRMLGWILHKGHGRFLLQFLPPAQPAPSLMTSLSTRFKSNGASAECSSGIKGSTPREAISQQQRPAHYTYANPGPSVVANEDTVQEWRSIERL
ncbi:hypothetical protein PR048_014640 [Dryococelus australis]|uniref:Uncharacterized protein n=1 Tax=Dryococelus australis TaxID=614101 RepID=A0ABQ9HES1_9NEOP|nr:hypothetical protein PR048_014640 [Dryococelus australis]